VSTRRAFLGLVVSVLAWSFVAAVLMGAVLVSAVMWVVW